MARRPGELKAHRYGALEPAWDELHSTEQARILRVLIERIDVAPDGISVMLHAAGIGRLITELGGPGGSCPASEPLLRGCREITVRAGLELDTLTIRIPIRLQRGAVGN